MAGNSAVAPPINGLIACVQGPMQDAYGNHIQLTQGTLAIQTQDCLQQHGDQCSPLQNAAAVRLNSRIWAFPIHGEPPGPFSFTKSSLLLSCCVRLETNYGHFIASPEREYQLWKSTGLMGQNAAPLLLIIDGVKWRILATAEGVIGEDVPFSIPQDAATPFKVYLKALRDGGELLRQVQEATCRGNKNLCDHREILYKIFHIMGHPPTRSHDLTKTPLVNFCLARCFHSDNLDLVSGGLTFDECMTFVKFLHVQVENHHPESAPTQKISVLDMYVDRVARGVEKTWGWKQDAWSIPERYTPPEYRENFKRLENKYRDLKLDDPGSIPLPQLLTGQLELVEESD